jgi:hypothetical protein
MKIKILKCCAGLKFSYSAGETADADDAIAKDLIQAGYAQEVKSSGKDHHAADSGTGQPC